jgi:UDP-N-acetylglucosamine--N-acetylmuramyl-(pentapeptide) pyrophosphoryl-undecaprenol N-acetylglucosamine transferase
MHGIAFTGFPAEPLYSLRTVRGWRAAANLLRASKAAGEHLKRRPSDALFSTGGYAGAPVMRAAKKLGIPYVIHEQNSVPGRSNLMFAKAAYGVATTFHAAERHFEGCRVVRTGLPVREDLRLLATRDRAGDEPLVLVVGGSQGAAAINEAALGTAQRMALPEVRWVHQTGKTHFEEVFHSVEHLGISSCYEVKPFFEGPEMGKAYAWASVVVGRSGAGTLSELAAFGLPSVLIPYPAAYAQHQLYNAREFEGLGAAKLIDQNDLNPGSLEAALSEWMSDETGRGRARKALLDWDVPDAASRILAMVEEASANN